jgi:hypothetical protein
MEPEEVDDNLLNNSLKGLVYFTGLDLGGSNPLHNAIFNAFTEPKRERAVQLNYKMLSADNELFHSRTTSHQQLERAGSTLCFCHSPTYSSVNSRKGTGTAKSFSWNH